MFPMLEEDLQRLLDYDGRRYWLSNGWCIRCRVRRCDVTEGRPGGVKYALTLHDETMARLLGFDNTHAVDGRVPFDHRHRFRRQAETVPYGFVDADRLLADFFSAVREVCQREGVEAEIVDEDCEEMDDGEEDA